VVDVVVVDCCCATFGYEGGEGFRGSFVRRWRGDGVRAEMELLDFAVCEDCGRGLRYREVGDAGDDGVGWVECL
jgi:hypothetical protein